jgi:hypothetical protein
MHAGQSGVEAFEAEAELLAVHQLDLLSQLEAQLRAVHKTMRIIEKLRSEKHWIGPRLGNEDVKPRCSPSHPNWGGSIRSFRFNTNRARTCRS